MDSKKGSESSKLEHRNIPQPSLRNDLALLCLNELFVGNQPFRLMKKQKPLYLRYEVDGVIRERTYLSPASWRATILFDIAEGKTFRMLEMDRPHRYTRLLPKTLLRRLLWHARPNANFPPIARLYDPNGNAELLLTRSRLCGHAVDALHNLSTEPKFQPLWVSDIMALRPMAGIELVRDESFSATAPIRLYLEAAAMTGRVVREPELRELPLSGNPTRLPAQAMPAYVFRLLDQLTKGAAPPWKTDFTIYDDYGC